MKIILLSTNFSKISDHAMRYAAALANELKAKKLVLYNMYSVSMNTCDIAPAFAEAEGIQSMAEENLLKRKQMVAATVPEMVVESQSDFGLTKQQIDEVAHRVHADLIVTGIESMNALEEAFDDSTSVHIVHNSKTPVLLVPPDAVWKSIRNIVWASDYRNLINNIPGQRIKNLLKDTGATLHVLHNDPLHKQTEISVRDAQLLIQSWFPDTDIRFEITQEKTAKEAICKYVTNYHIDLLISTPKKHNWLENLLSPCHSQQLAVKAHIPVLCIRSVE